VNQLQPATGALRATGMTELMPRGMRSMLGGLGSAWPEDGRTELMPRGAKNRQDRREGSATGLASITGLHGMVCRACNSTRRIK
jgi:hypothetical protein